MQHGNVNVKFENVLSLLFSNSPKTSCLISDIEHVDRLLQNTIYFSTITQILHRNKPCVFFFSVCLSKTLCRSLRPVYPRGRPVRKSRVPAWVRMLPVPVVRLPWVWEGARLQGISKQLTEQQPTPQSRRSVTSNYRLHQDSWMLMVLLFEILLATSWLHDFHFNLLAPEFGI